MIHANCIWGVLERYPRTGATVALNAIIYSGYYLQIEWEPYGRFVRLRYIGKRCIQYVCYNTEFKVLETCRLVATH